MRLIDADKIQVRDVIKGESRIAKGMRQGIQELIDMQPTLSENDWKKNKMILVP